MTERFLSNGLALVEKGASRQMVEVEHGVLLQVESEDCNILYHAWWSGLAMM